MHESGEMYLETLLILNQQLPFVRSVDIANELGYSKASVSRAIGILLRSGFITRDEHQYLELTPLGLKKAESIYERHCLVSEYFQMTLSLSKEEAIDNACRIEHVISAACFDAIKAYVLSHRT